MERPAGLTSTANQGALVSRYEELQRRYRDALYAEHQMRSRKKAVKSWQRVGWIAQITLFFIGIAIAELLLWLL